ncbi:nuclear transport factor 2 family protein [Caballeronia sp. INDeC2]|uniref:nuclear transport factor 2 family protein n=1 Tax=Caballeronia sp. INDeC2 TaxID=2921747 RepID=UPI0020287DD5|nr:nuclear transport factor 2 family protein [Caballeronia sp. INDeC2]
MNQKTIERQIIELEQARCRALVESDIATLQQLVADDLVHVHANGKADDKTAYLIAVREQIRFLEVRRDGLQIRAYGNVAVATGLLDQVIEMKETGQRIDMHVTTTQVWVRHSDSWQQTSFQATNT